MIENTIEEPTDDKKQKMYRRIIFWSSVLLSCLVTLWYFLANPPDSEEVQRMRLFFKENRIAVNEFIKLPREELASFAKKQSHPFYLSYIKASEVEKSRINALIHISTDYTPNQYWFNIFFLWTIALTTIWFLALMAQGVIILIQRDGDIL